MQSVPALRAGRGIFAPLALLLLLSACSPKAPEASAPAGPPGRTVMA